MGRVSRQNHSWGSPAERAPGFQAQLRAMTLGPAASGTLYHSLFWVREGGSNKECVLGEVPGNNGLPQELSLAPVRFSQGAPSGTEHK